jgi:hypothetical protein
MTLQEQVKEALKGIDEERTESPDGWWGTSEQAAFGAERLAKLLAVLDEYAYAPRLTDQIILSPDSDFPRTA